MASDCLLNMGNGFDINESVVTLKPEATGESADRYRIGIDYFSLGLNVAMQRGIPMLTLIKRKQL